MSKKFKVLLEGKNHLVRKDEGSLRKWGFFTTAFVEARNEEEAEKIAIELLRKDPKLRSQINNAETDPPIIEVDSVEEIASFERCNLPRTGLAWYDEEKESLTREKQKATLRREIRPLVSALSPEGRVALSRQARLILENQRTWKEARSILFYAPLPDELDISSLVQDSLAAGKTVALPRFDSATDKYVACQIQNFTTDIRVGQFAIREPADHCVPVPLNRVDLVLVPGVAFDLRGHRLGRGKGFYDRLLASVRGTTCGVAFDEQIVEQIPVEPHDVRLNCIVTPTRWIQS